MKANRLRLLGDLWLVLGILCTQFAMAGTVRDVRTNDRKMNAIYLKLGQSTVLRFKDAPRKVVVGNQNYFNIEFVEGSRDVTLQPLGTVKTNLFVYTKKETYGFILHPRNHGGYDDLVNVYWKEKPQIARVRARIIVLDQNRVKKVSLPLNTGDWSGEIYKITKSKNSKTVILDLKFKNLSSAPRTLKNLSLFATRRNRLLEKQNFAVDEVKVSPLGSTNARLVVTLKKRLGFTVNLKIDGKQSKVIVSRSKIL